MGTYFSQYQNPPGVAPMVTDTPSFDPNYGFSGTRKERVMVATEAEMISAKVPLEDRDYCAHLYIAYKDCRQRKFPFLYRCAHDKHTYLTCEYEDYILRMKEFERERRLRSREHRLLGAAA